MSGFSETLAQLRREAGLSQRVAAEELGISQALLSHYENGAREPRLEFISRVCAYYGVTSDYILGRTGTRDGVITLKRCPGGAEPIFETVRRVFALLCDIADDELTASALAYLAIPAENVDALLRNPDAQYDAMRDVELKTAEARLITSARRVRNTNNPENQGCSDD